MNAELTTRAVAAQNGFEIFERKVAQDLRERARNRKSETTYRSKTKENVMRSRWLLASELAGCFALGWGTHVVTAQRRTPVSVTRLYTGSDGETHAEEIADTRLTPDAARNGLEVSDVIRVSGLQFARTALGWVRDSHVAERHLYIVTLSGRGEIELAGGRKIPLEPGSVILAEDSTGKGHISRTIGTEDRIALNIQLADR
jgi:hypothetical protein